MPIFKVDSITVSNLHVAINCFYQGIWYYHDIEIVLIIQHNRFNNCFLITKRTEHLNVFKKSE